jgi:peptidoglycan/xylan/chitin deacetylase (PgdA/CDA1 family)
MQNRKPYASLSLDLDNKWSYLKTHGDSGWESFPSYLDIVVPRVLDILNARNLTITCFIVGQDAGLAKNRDAIGSIGAAGHEIGNHSFAHDPWLHLYSEQQINAELAKAEEAIESTTGRRTRGFRGPGFVHSEAILRVLMRRGYRYDASTFPTFTGPIARLYYFMSARLDAEEKRLRAELFGGFKEGFRPLKPYRWRDRTGTLLEIPVTTMPVSRLPIHVSYILYLSVFSEALALGYFRTALQVCRTAGVAPSVLLHPLDFLGREDAPELSFFPAMGLGRERKAATLTRIFDALCGAFDVITVGEHAENATRSPGLAEIALDTGPGRAVEDRRTAIPSARESRRTIISTEALWPGKNRRLR